MALLDFLKQHLQDSEHALGINTPGHGSVFNSVKQTLSRPVTNPLARSFVTNPISQSINRQGSAIARSPVGQYAYNNIVDPIASGSQNITQGHPIVGAGQLLRGVTHLLPSTAASTAAYDVGAGTVVAGLKTLKHGGNLAKNIETNIVNPTSTPATELVGEQFAKQHPWLTTGLDIGLGSPTALTSVPKALKALSKGKADSAIINKLITHNGEPAIVTKEGNVIRVKDYQASLPKETKSFNVTYNGKPARVAADGSISAINDYKGTQGRKSNGQFDTLGIMGKNEPTPLPKHIDELKTNPFAGKPPVSLADVKGPTTAELQGPQVKERGLVTTIKESPTTPKEVASTIKGSYEVLHNKDVIAQSANILKQGEQPTLARIASEPPGALKSRLTMDLARSYADSGQFEKSTALLQNLSEHGGTNLGQAVQILSTYDKMSPEGLLHYAAGQATKAGKVLDPELAKSIYERAKAKANLPDEFAQNKATLGILQDIQNNFSTGQQKFMKVLDEYRYGNMLSSPLTHISNIASNLIQGTLTRPAVKLVSGTVDNVASALTGKARTQYISEVPAYYRGMFSSFGEAFQNAGNALKGNKPITNLDLQGIPSNSKILAPWRGVSRALDAADQFFQTLGTAAEREGLNTRYSELGKLVSPEGLQHQAQAEAAKTLFRAPLDSINATGQGKFNSAIDRGAEAISNIPGIKWFAPFIKTPTQIVKQGLELVPGVGLANLPGNANKAELIAKQVVGSLVFAGAAHLGLQGRLSWAAPRSGTQKDEFYASGRQPYSVKIGDKWVAFSKLGPLAYPIAAASAMQWYTHDNPSAVTKDTLSKWGDTIAGLAGFFGDQSYMKGVGDLVGALSGDTSALANLKSDIPGQLIPFASFQRWLTRAIDPVQKNPANVTEVFKQGIPGLSKSVPARLDSQGNPIPIENPLINAINPFKTTTANQAGEQGYQTSLDVSRIKNQQIADTQAAKDAFKRGDISGLTPEQIRSYQKSLATDALKASLNPTEQAIFGTTDAQKKALLSQDPGMADTIAKVNALENSLNHSGGGTVNLKSALSSKNPIKGLTVAKAKKGRKGRLVKARTVKVPKQKTIKLGAPRGGAKGTGKLRVKPTIKRAGATLRTKGSKRSAFGA